MLLEVAYNIVSKIVCSRLQPVVEKLDRESQCDFIPGRGCADAVFTVKLAMTKLREHCSKNWIGIIDIIKAFGRVPCDILWIVPERFGFPPKIISIVKSRRKTNVKFAVGTVTDIRSSIVDVKPVDILGLILSTIFIAAIMITSTKCFDRPLCILRIKKDFILTGSKLITEGINFSLSDSEYIDDTAVLFDSREDLEKISPFLLNRFENFGIEVHVDHCNQPNKPSKTEVLFVSVPPSSYTVTTNFDNRNLKPINLGNNKFLPVVTRFSCLGTNLNIDCRNNKVVVFRITKAGNAFGTLRKCLLSNSNISVFAKQTVYEGLILPILLHGAGSWFHTKNLFSVLRIFQYRCVRSICRVTLSQCLNIRISNGELLRRLNLRTIGDYVTKRQLHWAGYLARMDFDRLLRKMLSCGYVLNALLVQLNIYL